MTGRLVVVSGTGTGIGKTHLSEAILLALGRRGARCAGVKPVETGFDDSDRSDASRLARASSFHVKHSGARFEDPVSPHIAARDAGRPISLATLSAEVSALRPMVDVLLAELAGGLFSPLSDVETNASFTALLRPDFHILVAPDRLGVLHDLIAATQAARAMRLPINGIALVAPPIPDPSTGRNAPELPRLLAIPYLASVPRASPAMLADTPSVAVIAAALAPAPL
jgi:dethiobiotin synthetase